MRRLRLWIGVALLFIASHGYAGGPPILTLIHVPDFFVVGQPGALRFSVRSWCCEHEVLDSKAYSVRAETTGRPEFRTPAMPTGKNREYLAVLALPAPGDWKITIDYAVDSYSAASVTSPPAYRTAILPGGDPPAPLSLVAQGERAFVEKGCSSCHIRGEVTGPKYPSMGWTTSDSDNDRRWENVLRSNQYPDLSGRKFSDEDLLRFLAKPSAVRPAARMPELDLSRDDIAALIAFLNR